MHALLSALERFSLHVDRIAGLFLGLITVLVFASAIGRYLFTAPVPDSFDIARLMLGVGVMWGLASIGFRGGHIGVDLLVQVLPRRAARYLEAFGWIVLLVFTVLLTWKLFERVESAAGSGESTFDLRVPVWPFLAVAWAGVAASLVTVSTRILALILDVEQDGQAHHPPEEEALYE